jgi:hypothetical protein
MKMSIFVRDYDRQRPFELSAQWGIEKVLISRGSLLYLLTKTGKILNSGVRVMVFNATFNNISVHD